MQVFAYKMCNFLKKVFQCPPSRAIFLSLCGLKSIDLDKKHKIYLVNSKNYSTFAAYQ